MLAAEVVGLAFEFKGTRSLCGVHIHAADRVFRASRSTRRRNLVCLVNLEWILLLRHDFPASRASIIAHPKFSEYEPPESPLKEISEGLICECRASEMAHPACGLLEFRQRLLMPSSVKRYGKRRSALDSDTSLDGVQAVEDSPSPRTAENGPAGGTIAQARPYL